MHRHTEACDSGRRWDYCTFCANKWLDFKWPFTLNLQESQRAAGRALNIYQLRKTAVAVLPLLRCLYEKRIYCARHITRSVLRWVLISEHHSFAHSLASSSKSSGFERSTQEKGLFTYEYKSLLGSVKFLVMQRNAERSYGFSSILELWQTMSAPAVIKLGELPAY